MGKLPIETNSNLKKKNKQKIEIILNDLIELYEDLERAVEDTFQFSAVVEFLTITVIDRPIKDER